MVGGSRDQAGLPGPGCLAAERWESRGAWVGSPGGSWPCGGGRNQIWICAAPPASSDDGGRVAAASADGGETRAARPWHTSRTSTVRFPWKESRSEPCIWLIDPFRLEHSGAEPSLNDGSGEDSSSDSSVDDDVELLVSFELLDAGVSSDTRLSVYGDFSIKWGIPPKVKEVTSSNQLADLNGPYGISASSTLPDSSATPNTFYAVNMTACRERENDASSCDSKLKDLRDRVSKGEEWSWPPGQMWDPSKRLVSKRGKIRVVLDFKGNSSGKLGFKWRRTSVEASFLDTLFGTMLLTITGGMGVLVFLCLLRGSHRHADGGLL